MTANTNLLFLSEQLFILCSVTLELLCKLHLAIYGFSQVLGQNGLMSLTGATVRSDEIQSHRQKCHLAFST